MLHTETALTPEMASELARLCEALPAAGLAELAQSEPAWLDGGFRADRPAALRTRLRQAVLGPQPVSDGARRLLAAHALNRPLVSRLSCAALLELRHEWAALLGGPRLLLAMLLDERADVRDAAGRWLGSDRPFVPVDPAAAAAVVREAFGGLLAAAGIPLPDGAGVLPDTGRDRGDGQDRLRVELSELRAENRRLKGSDERLARARDRLKAADADAADARARLEEAAGQVRQLGRERDEARLELARETARRDERLAVAVEARLAREYAGWLAAARRLEEAASSGAAAPDDLLARAEAALARQAAEDRHSGNRARLRTRLDRVEELQARSRDSLAAAVHQTPELRRSGEELAAEAARLRGLLGLEPSASACEAALAAHLNGAHANDLPHLRALVGRLAGLGALDALAAARLEALLARRQAIALAAGEVPPADAAGDALRLLQDALAGRRPAILLVDGHNALFGLQGRYLAPQGSAIPDGNKRTRLVADVVHRFKDHPACRAWIVFDGPEASDASPAPNVRVTYSGGQGANRADGVLLDNVRFLRAVDPAMPILLVSNDHALGAEARRLGAQTLTALELGSVL